MLGDFFCWKVRWSYFSKGSMWLVCLIVLNGVGHKNWRVRNSTMYWTVQRNFDLQPFTLKTKRLLRHITRWCTSHKVTMIIRYYLNRKLYCSICKKVNLSIKESSLKVFFSIPACKKQSKCQNTASIGQHFNLDWIFAPWHGKRNYFQTWSFFGKIFKPVFLTLFANSKDERLFFLLHQ